MEILPVNPEWIHSHLLEPYLQGITLLEFAWSGKDDSIIPKEFSWKNRIVCWLQGMTLLTPVIGTIVWIVWRTFGTPQLLADPSSPEILESPQGFPLQIQIQRAEAEPLQMVPEGHIRHPEQYIFQEYHGTNLELPAYRTSWNVQYFPGLVIANQTCINPRFDSSYVYSSGLVLKEFNLLRGDTTFQIRVLDETKEIYIKYDSTETSCEKMLPCPLDAPLIQHPVIGLKNFVLSEDMQTSFYSVMPQNPLSSWFPNWILRMLPKNIGNPPFLEKVNAQKTGIEVIPGYGPTIKVEVSSSRGFPFNLFKAESWFDKSTGRLVKFINPFNKMSGTFAQFGPLRE